MRRILSAVVCAVLVVAANPSGPVAADAGAGDGGESSGQPWHGTVNVIHDQEAVPRTPGGSWEELDFSIAYTVVAGMPDSASYSFAGERYVQDLGCSGFESGSGVVGDISLEVDPPNAYGQLPLANGEFWAPGTTSLCGSGADYHEVGLGLGYYVAFDPQLDPATGDVLLVGEITDTWPQDIEDFVITHTLTIEVDLRCDAPCPVSETCDGLEYADVQGVPLSYGPSTLASFPNSDLACKGFWLPYANDGFVPQGLALSGGTAWVSGYREDPVAGAERCRLVQVDLDTGSLIRGIRGISTNFGGRRLWCEHGGGLALTQHGLWISDTRYLWLLDPARVGVSNPVIRAWSLVGSVRGSFLLQGPAGRLGLGVWNDTGAGKTHWYRFSDLLRPGITALIAQNAGDLDFWEKRAVLTGSAPRRAQGGAYESSSPTFTSSTAGCGMVVYPGGSRRGFGPGAEELQFTSDGKVWAVFESGSEPYQALGRPHVPMLAQFDADALRTGDNETCSW